MEHREGMILVGARRRLGRHLAEDLARDHRLVLTSSVAWEGDTSTWIKDLPITAQARTLVWNARDAGLLPLMMADMARLRAEGITLSGAVLLPGAFPEDPFGEWDPESLQALWEVNLTFPLLAAQAILPHLAPGGCLHLILDSCIHRPFLKRLPYSVAKTGLAALVPGLARLAAPQVRVVGHALGTLLPDEGSDPAFLAGRTLLDRLGEPGDLARAVRYAQGARHLTGDILTLDGGWRWK